jgi:hypothetical protein
MDQTSLKEQNTIGSVQWVQSMTASEANHQRVLALILAEDSPAFQQVWDALDNKSPTERRGKPPMSEARLRSISRRPDSSQATLSAPG